jgi:hypothetical protein
LIDYARHEYRLSKVDNDGVSLRVTLQTVERMTGRMPDEGINPVEFPDVLWDLWHQFLELNASRGSGGMGGPAPITQLDMYAYCQLRRIWFEGWELNAFRLLDQIALSSISDTKS